MARALLAGKPKRGPHNWDRARAATNSQRSPLAPSRVADVSWPGVESGGKKGKIRSPKNRRPAGYHANSTTRDALIRGSFYKTTKPREGPAGLSSVRRPP